MAGECYSKDARLASQLGANGAKIATLTCIIPPDFLAFANLRSGSFAKCLATAAFMVSRPQDSEISFLRRPGAPGGAPANGAGSPLGDHPEGFQRGGPHRPSVAVRELQL